jgi:hypothetical protein
LAFEDVTSGLSLGCVSTGSAARQSSHVTAHFSKEFLQIRIRRGVLQFSDADPDFEAGRQLAKAA